MLRWILWNALIYLKVFTKDRPYCTIVSCLSLLLFLFFFVVLNESPSFRLKKKKKNKKRYWVTFYNVFYRLHFPFLKLPLVALVQPSLSWLWFGWYFPIIGQSGVDLIFSASNKIIIISHNWVNFGYLSNHNMTFWTWIRQFPTNDSKVSLRLEYCFKHYCK